MNTAPINPDGSTTIDNPFTRLAEDLVSRGYTAGDAIDGLTTYAHPDGGGILATLDSGLQMGARLSGRDDDGDPTWTIRLSADTPVPVQRIILHAALHAGTSDEQAVLGAIGVTIDPRHAGS